VQPGDQKCLGRVPDHSSTNWPSISNEIVNVSSRGEQCPAAY